MRYGHKTVWREGMFLQPQHFQQYDRYLERKQFQQLQQSLPYYTGFDEIIINQQFLGQGKVVIEKAQATFQDGTFYNAPDEDVLPEALSIPIGTKNITIYLGIYDRRLLVVNNQAANIQRQHSTIIECIDTTEAESLPAEIEVSCIKPCLLTDQYDLSNFCLLPIAKIKEVRPDGKIYLDQHFVEPRLTIQKQSWLMTSLEEIYGLLVYRADILSKRLDHEGQSESVRVSDFMMLELMNKYLVKMKCLLEMPYIFGHQAYEVLVTLLAQLSTYTSQQRTPDDQLSYNHNNVYESYFPVFEQLRSALNLVLEQHAKAISLLDHGNGLYIAENIKENMMQNAEVVLGIYANVSQDELRENLNNQLKIGLVSEIKDMVSRGVSGIQIESLPNAPRQIPHHANFVYFSLDLNNDLWEKIIASNSMAMHLGVDYQDIRLELWSVHS